MTDRELLELAAKAAGIDVVWCDKLDVGLTDDHIIPHPRPHFVMRASRKEWNPLTDDGDALRLAATLRLKVLPGKHKGDGCTVESQRPGIAGCTAFRDSESHQMREAITRAAAEIGKAVP